MCVYPSKMNFKPDSPLYFSCSAEAPVTHPQFNWHDLFQLTSQLGEDEEGNLRLGVSYGKHIFK